MSCNAYIRSKNVRIGFVNDVTVAAGDFAFAIVPRIGNSVNFDGIRVTGRIDVRKNLDANGCVGCCGDIMTLRIDMLLFVMQIINGSS